MENEMSEIIVISGDDELEEGEIADDNLSEPRTTFGSVPKEKKLPRRYILHENKDLNSKHKKNCKRTNHHRRKKCVVQPSPSVHKKHHKSCRHHNLEQRKLKVGQFNHPKNNLFMFGHRENRNSHYYSSTSNIKSAFKNFSSPRRAPIPLIRKITNQPQPTKANSFPQISLKSEKTKEELKDKKENLSSIDFQKENSSVKCVTKSLNEENVNILETKQNYHKLISEESETKVNGEESEDEEELRRIALSTCLKRPDMDIKPAQDNTVANYMHSSDNYEIVDMEVEDNDGFTENVNSADLFVIDRNPIISSEPLPNSNFNSKHSADSLPSESYNHKLESELSLSPTQSNEDFEAELLRAELIANMNFAYQGARESPDKQFGPLKNGTQTQVQLPFVKKIQAIQNAKVKSATFCKPLVPKFINIPRKRVVNKAKLNYSKLNSHQNQNVVSPPQRNINAVQERIVITLNKDSSTEESDEEQSDKSKEAQENVSVAKIEALISDCRQKSDVHKVTGNDLKNVSCLSKAQQEEYNSLKKILAEKQVLPMQSKTINDQKTSQLKIVTKRLSIANDKLRIEREILNDVQKELQSKKQVYMASKLKAQHLKEQLHAAERVRASNLESWKKSAAKLDIQKKSVLKHEAIVDLLEKRLNSKGLLPKPNLALSPSQKNDSLAI